MREGTQRGFTLIELMVVVGLIAVLAAIVVPGFFHESSVAKVEAEISSFFAELGTKEEAFKVERGVYWATGTTEGDLFPAGTLTGSDQQVSGSLPQTWLDIKFIPPQPRARCGYVVQAGLADESTGAKAQEFGMDAAPPVTWMYILARCNLDGDNTRDTFAFKSSMDGRIQWQNSGH